jgi:endonuclease III
MQGSKDCICPGRISCLLEYRYFSVVFPFFSHITGKISHVFSFYHLSMRTLERITTVFTQLEKLYAGATTELVYTTPFQLLIAVAMSAQTTDKQVNTVTAKFFDRVCVPDDVCTMTEAARSRCVQGVNYAPTKAKHLYRTAHILRDQFASQIPQTEAELVTLP